MQIAGLLKPPEIQIITHILPHTPAVVPLPIIKCQLRIEPNSIRRLMTLTMLPRTSKPLVLSSLSWPLSTSSYIWVPSALSQDQSVALTHMRQERAVSWEWTSWLQSKLLLWSHGFSSGWSSLRLISGRSQNSLLVQLQWSLSASGGDIPVSSTPRISTQLCNKLMLFKWHRIFRWLKLELHHDQLWLEEN